MRAGPHERAHHGLREEEAIGVAGLDPGDPDVGRDAHDPQPVGRRRDGASRVGSVAVVVVGRDLARNGRAAHAVHAVGVIDVRREVRVRVVEARVDVAHDHARTPASYLVRLGRLDLSHVPLQAEQVLAGVGHRRVHRRGRSTGRGEVLVAQPDRRARRRRYGSDATVTRQAQLEGRAARPGYGDADRPVTRDQGAAGAPDRRPDVGGHGLGLVDHEIGGGLPCTERCRGRQHEAAEQSSGGQQGQGATNRHSHAGSSHRKLPRDSGFRLTPDHAISASKPRVNSAPNVEPRSGEGLGCSGADRAGLRRGRGPHGPWHRPSPRRDREARDAVRARTPAGASGQGAHRREPRPLGA